MNDFLITIDVEDWFQVENLRPWNPPALWGSRELRVERNTHALLDLFDDIKLEAGSRKLEAKDGFAPSCLKGNPENPVNPVGHPFTPAPCAVRRAPSSSVRCTFFVLGWVARRLPHLVRAIAARGHEVASHGSSHRMCIPLGDAELREDLLGSKRLLEDLLGAEVAGFRAPNFSVDDRVLDIVRECGYRYDSSYNSFALHGRYGKVSLNGNRAGIAHRVAEDFFELPVSNLSFGLPSLKPQASSRSKRPGAAGCVLPWSGGAYFRLVPLWVFQAGVQAILDRDGAYVFYMHPWEIDPGQPHVKQASMASRFKHYTNLRKTRDRLQRMMEGFADCRFVRCREYLKS